MLNENEFYINTKSSEVCITRDELHKIAYRLSESFKLISCDYDENVIIKYL